MVVVGGASVVVMACLVPVVAEGVSVAGVAWS